MKDIKTYKFTAEITRDNKINQYIGLQEMTEEEVNNIPDFVAFSKRIGKALYRSFEKRNKSEYNDFFDYDEDTVKSIQFPS